MQLSIEHAIAACTAKAESRGFDSEAARGFVLGYLRDCGPTWGEDLVAEARYTGRNELDCHDGRAWGSVFATLSKRKLIVCLRSDGIRKNGHGTSGARLWALAQ